MGWLSAIFGSSTNSRRGQALSSTHDAFSLPTSSPILAPHPDAFIPPDTIPSPGPDSALTPSYSYPPQGGAYGYIPTSTGRSQRTSLLPLHNDRLHRHAGPSDYPPLASTWNRLRLWLDREYPELGDTLNYGILPEDLAEIEMSFGFALPQALRESYLCVDGQEAESSAGCAEGLFFGLSLLPLESVLEEWRFWREVDDDPLTGANPQLREQMQSIPPNWVRREYSQRGWIPLIGDKMGNYIGIDLSPAEAGVAGQVIVFGRDFDTKVVLWRGDGVGGWGKWLASFVEELENGDTYDIGNGAESEGSEDDIGYESYYHDGTGNGQGDGGGDSSSKGGLRLIGEYRGWNVMDAWADRSVRRWYEAGVISESDVQGQEKTTDVKVDVDNLNLSSKATEVAIPVLADVSEPKSGPPSSTHTPRPDLPTISITKPPVPMPVELPTPRDIQSLPSPPESINITYNDDLESGQARGMRDEAETSPLSTRLPTPPPTADDTKPPSSPSQQPSVSHEQEHDLLVDTAPELPSNSPTSPQTPTPEPPLLASSSDSQVHPSLSSDTSILQTPASSSEPESVGVVDGDAADPNTTIRLIGGGGVAGVIGDDKEEPEQSPDGGADADDTASISSVVSTNSTKTHKKTKSGLAGLKKLGKIGALRKTDSKSSIKDMTK